MREGRNEFVPELPGLSERHRGPCAIAKGEIRADSNEVIDASLMRPIATNCFNMADVEPLNTIVKQGIVGERVEGHIIT